MMNSSKEMVKQIRKLARMPGITSGRTISRKVDQRRLAQIQAASSSERSSDWKAEVRIATAKGVQISTWPRMTGEQDSGTFSDSSTTRSAIATIISGRTRGSMISPMIGALPGKR
jgi:2-oxoglutarate dehydrogenase complex dehydrogenase (E1) component-like enzyme